ncbi:hypothetical protein Ancab_037126 [Ancistrocladus abbreviatus]
MFTPTAAYLTAIAVLVAAADAGANAAAYTNHTVGGSAGWFFNVTTNTSSTNYSAWAATQTFNLGDFLIFNTNTNQTVVQTYNLTIYNSCTTDEAGDDTSIYDSGSDKFSKALALSVPLTKEGPNYFFSDADDAGVQCEHGMRFEIQVNHGLGLPPSLNQPPPPAYTPPPVAEPPPVFEGSGGGQGQSISGCSGLSGGGALIGYFVVGLAFFGIQLAV